MSDELYAALERAQKALAENYEKINALRLEVAQLRAENERQHAAQVHASTAYMLATGRNQHYEAQIKRLEAERDALIADALREF